MNANSQVFDSDTHVNPAAEVLDRYVDPGFRARLPDLAPYRVAASTVIKPADGAVPLHLYRFNDKVYKRVLGQAQPHPTFKGGAREAKWRGSKDPRAGVRDDNPENRIKRFQSTARRSND